MLNFLFQSAAAIVFKRAIVLMNQKLDKEKVFYKQLVTYHDEAELELDPKDVDEVKQIVYSSVKEAGEFYSLHVPIEADIKTGRSWAEVH